nr:fumarate hydratase [Candidatus Prometheoarchaeum syntrophicum]QEE17704.1 fumarate hydratase [Candidatus Prometheoarchaeum syntrophicum]
MDKPNLLKIIEKSLYSLISYSAQTVTKRTIIELEKMLEKEKNNDIAHSQLELMLENISYGNKHQIPVCQDTGTVNVFIQLGENFPIISDFKDIITKILAQLTNESKLRANTVDPIKFQNPGDNSGLNTPPIYLELIPNRDDLIITILNKGGGCENISALYMLNPATGFEDLKPLILKKIKDAGGKPCPPIIVGIGIGGDSVKSVFLAKKAILRPIGTRNRREEVSDLETYLLKQINKLDIGVMGLREGHSNCIDVHIEWGMRHPASYPVGLVVECYSHRTVSGCISKDGEFFMGYLDRDYNFKKMESERN